MKKRGIEWHDDEARIRDPLHHRGQRAGGRHRLAAPEVVRCWSRVSSADGTRRGNDGVAAIFTSGLARAIETVRIAFPDAAVPVFMGLAASRV